MKPPHWCGLSWRAFIWGTRWGRRIWRICVAAAQALYSILEQQRLRSHEIGRLCQTVSLLQRNHECFGFPRISVPQSIAGVIGTRRNSAYGGRIGHRLACLSQSTTITSLGNACLSQRSMANNNAIIDYWSDPNTKSRQHLGGDLSTCVLRVAVFNRESIMKIGLAIKAAVAFAGVTLNGSDCRYRYCGTVQGL